MKVLSTLKGRSAATRERDDLITGSLATSSMLSQRLLQWSGSNHPERQVSMSFHEEWRHESCPVMQWYEPRRVSSTRFQSVEHRRDAQGPFYHEYLLLVLTDGAVCRVERMGEGSRTDAIRYIGCKSHDLIQWFPKDKRRSASVASSLIAEVDLGREFDILDVLAVCYAIQNTKLSSVYTLQRYNCYFLCLTILVILARRVAAWETAITADTWDSCVAATCDKLSSLSQEEAKEHAMLRLCAVLDPGNPNAGACVINALRSKLIDNVDCLGSHTKLMSSLLWHRSWESELPASLKLTLSSAVDTILMDDAECGHQLQKILAIEVNTVAKAMTGSKQLLDWYTITQAQAATAGFTLMIRKYTAIERMRHLECPVPLRLRAHSTLGGYILAVMVTYGGSTFPGLGDHSDPMNRFDNMVSRKLPFGTVSAFGRIKTLSEFKGLEDLEEGLEEAWDEVSGGFTSVLLTPFVLNALAADTQANKSDLRLLLAIDLDRAALEELLSSLVAPGLVGALRLGLEKQQPCLTIQVPLEGTPELSKQTLGVTEFQQSYISHRIEAHAKRVERHRLASATLVRLDMENTMGKVWKLLPTGFGGVLQAQKVEANIPHGLQQV